MVLKTTIAFTKNHLGQKTYEKNRNKTISSTPQKYLFSFPFLPFAF